MSTSEPSRWTAGTIYPDMWLDPQDDPRETEVTLVGERETLVEYLRTYRLTLELKCAGLSDEQLAARSVPPSTMSLLGLIRHMAEVERGWFRRFMAGGDAAELYCTPESRDEDWDGAAPDAALVEQAWTAWRAEVAYAEQLVRDSADLGVLGKNGKTALREVLVHMIEEYARHCGHADLLRESIDGRIGQ